MFKTLGNSVHDPLLQELKKLKKFHLFKYMYTQLKCSTHLMEISICWLKFAVPIMKVNTCCSAQLNNHLPQALMTFNPEQASQGRCLFCNELTSIKCLAPASNKYNIYTALEVYNSWQAEISHITQKLKYHTMTNKKNI